VAVAIAAAAVVAIVLVVVLAGGGSSSDDVAAAPGACLDSWNGSEANRSYTRHNRTFHRYTDARVGYLDTSSTPAVSADASAGPCVVVFPRSSADPELNYAGEVEGGGRWAPLSETLTPEQVGALQSAALEATNTVPTEQGELQPSG